ncbi:PhzF family phenazine biosynthesis protein [Marinomonas transparens]|uniref:PhzF family phenazine biosynthesis protein n=1 Tax=Marinomonas transparens TaxID=2795388 RepID=A0A934JTS5_9GAMM|nr:PhzF family phenazine biosynthesis protein [Marinomonas transparens]MBJ7536907.1 PhzF family phenazine biosynthesis protein [Marinomonas transparens]
MAQVEVHLVRAFSISESGGNLAGVVLNADTLTRQQKQHIAMEVGVSEVAFISQSEKAHFQVSFYTPTGEVGFCGHATLGAFWLLHHLKLISVGRFQQETKAGILDVEVLSHGDIVMDQSLPVWLTEFQAFEVAPLLGIDAQLIDQTELPVQVISTGLADVIIPVPYGVLDLLEPNDAAISNFCRQHKVVGFHVFELNPPTEFYTASCRNFAPLVGIPEESATGSSNGALACYLNKHFGYLEPVFEQGRVMDMSSRVMTKLMERNGQVMRVQVGGEATFEKRLLINTDDCKG